MTIKTSYPSDKRRPGSGVEFDLTSGSRGLVPVDRSMLLIGIAKGGTVAAGVSTQIFSESDAETSFGVGTEVTLQCRMALAVSRLLGAAPKIYAIGIDEPGASVAATSQFAVSGTATAGGEVVFRIAGRTMRASVANGDAAAAVATAMKTAIDRLAGQLPVTALVASANVNLTHRHTGVTGNDVVLEVVDKPAGISIALTQPTTGTGTVSVVAALDAALSRDYWTIGFAEHTATDITNFKTHSATAWGTTTKRYRFGFFADRVSLAAAQTLASGANDKTVIVGSYPLSPSLPSEIAAALATMAVIPEKPNYNHNGTSLPLYPPAMASVLNDAQIESALGSGVTPLTVDVTETYAKMERLITTQTTVGTTPYEGCLDIGNPFAIARVAKELDFELALAMQQRNVDASLLGDLRTIARERLRTRERSGWLQNVEAHMGELKVEPHPTVPTRILLEIPDSVVPIANQVIAKHVLLIEAPVTA